MDQPLAGFWRRLGAFIVDRLLLAGVGFALGFALWDLSARLGLATRAIGYAIAVAYWGLLDSGLGGGATPGKRLLNIRVVGAGGAPISPAAGLLRAAVLFIPMAVNGLPLPLDVSTAKGVSSALTAGMFLAPAMLYMILCNRRTRQGLHDLAGGAYVVNAAAAGPLEAKPVWMGHYGLLAGGMIVVLALGEFGSRIILNLPGISELLPVSRKIQEAGMTPRSISRIKLMLPKGMSEDLVVANVILHEPPTDDTPAAVARLLFEGVPDIDAADRVSVSVSHGFDYGLARWSHVTVKSLPPEKWRELLAQK